jgi:hypothetical protein
MDVSAGFDVARVGIPVDLVGFDLHVGSLDADLTAKMAPASLHFLDDLKCDGLFRILRGVGADRENLPVRIGTDRCGLRRGRR